MAKKYLMGLDLGTDSVGWCVTDECGHIVKKQGKRLWGVNLFSESGDCKERRINRVARRRIKRRKERIALLQSLMKEEICKVDPNFLVRLNYSFLHEDDKPNLLKDEDGTLFAGVGGANDKDFYKENPTIYHLRKKLLESDEKADIRELYLVLHHMVKYRGNFLQSGDWNIKSNDALVESFKLINESLDKLGIDIQQRFTCEDDVLEHFASTVNSAKTKALKDEAVKGFFNKIDFKNNKYLKLVTKMIAGSKVAVKDLYEDYIDDEDEIAEVKAIEFGSSSIDDDLIKLDSVVNDRPETQIIKAAKGIYDFLKLRDLLGERDFLSYAMVSIYEKHSNDLKDLKKFIKSIPNIEEAKRLYNLTFRENKEDLNNYCRYIGMVNTGGERQRTAHCKPKDFYDFLKKNVFANNVSPDDEYVKSVYESMENLKYLPRQNDSGNGIYPYQLNKAEMEIILEKQSKHYPFLNISDEYGTVKDKIISILTFKIDYYVGPLMAEKESDPRSSHSWVVFKENGSKKITPWNYDDLIDEDASSEKFIRRMLNKCTYFGEADVLPKYSLLYSEYEVIEFLTKILINGKPLNNISYGEGDITMDEMIDFFKTHKSDLRGMKKFIKEKTGGRAEPSITFASKNVDVEQEDMPNTMSACIDFSRILGSEYLKDQANRKNIEEIILDLSVFPDREIVKKRLGKYGFSEEQKRSIKSLNYSGFGRFSEKFLHLMSRDKEFDENTGEIFTISFIDAMKKYGKNHISLLNDEAFEFKKIIADSQASTSESYKDVNEYVSSLYMAPQMRRPVIRAYKIIAEVEKILGDNISEFYVECTRKIGKKERTKSRYQLLKDLYKKANSNDLDKSVVDKLEEKNQSDPNFLRSDKNYLYFLQLGKDVYTGEPIDFDDLINCDIDHIVPQSVRKDDSLDNRVLTHQEKNKEKSDTYPLKNGFLNQEAKNTLKVLLKLKLISKNKYAAITRREGDYLTDDEIFDFTNRQLTVTNQAIIALKKTIQAFSEKGKEPKIILSRANAVSDFRQQYDLVKCREINDFHHAHDAYLNVIVGKTIASYFGMDRPNPKLWVEQLRKKKLTTNTKKIFENPDGKKDSVCDFHGNVIWNYQESIKEIKDAIYKRFDVMTTVTPVIEKGLFRKVSIHPASDDKGDNLIPIKQNLIGKCKLKELDPGFTLKTSKYGGFSDLTNGFASLLLLKDKKGKNFYKLEFIPNARASFADSSSIEKYLLSIYGDNFVKLELPIVRINSILRINGSDVYLSGKTEEYAIVRSARQAFFDKKTIESIKTIEKVLSRLSDAKINVFKDYEYNESFIKKTGLKIDGKILNIPAIKDGTKTISDSDLLSLYDELANSLNGKTMKAYSESALDSERMKDPKWRDAFINLDQIRKCAVISEILKIVKGNSSESANLSLITGPKSTSQRKIRREMPDHFEILAKSITGFYTKTIFKI